MHATFNICHHFTNVVLFYKSLASPRSPIPITKSTCILKLVCTQSQFPKQHFTDAVIVNCPFDHHISLSKI